MEEVTALELANCVAEQAEELLDAYRVLKVQTSTYVKVELCAESVLQMKFSFLLLVFSYSKTRTATGLEAAFSEDESNNTLLLGIPPEISIIMNVIWTAITSWSSYIQGMSCTKDHFPFISKVILGVFVVVSLLISCSVTLIYLAPTLGLFDLLAHYQGENLPYWAASELIVKRGKSLTTEMVYYPGTEPFPWSDLTRFDYSNPDDPQSPPLTLYTYFETETYLIGFWVLLVLQALVILAIKKVTNPKVYQKKTWLQILTHCLQDTQIVSPMEDWDDEHGPIAHYVERQGLVEKEMFGTLMVNLAFNLFMTIPMIIFGNQNCF